MTQVSVGWEKTSHQEAEIKRLTRSNGRAKFLIGGVFVLAAALYLIISGTLSGARYFITVDELVNNPIYMGETVRITGAVIGESIIYDTSDPNMTVIKFVVANIPNETDDLAQTLHDAVNDPNATRLEIRVENEPMPDLLQNEAQAILTGTLGEDGIFHANELLLKCPSRFEEGEASDALADL